MFIMDGNKGASLDEYTLSKQICRLQSRRQAIFEGGRRRRLLELTLEFGVASILPVPTAERWRAKWHTSVLVISGGRMHTTNLPMKLDKNQ